MMMTKIISSISVILSKIINNVLNILKMKKSESPKEPSNEAKVNESKVNGAKVKATNAIPYPKGGTTRGPR